MGGLTTIQLVAASVTALYGVVSLVGGIIGYLKANSVASLVAGGIAGLLLILCAAGAFRGMTWTLGAALVLALLLAGRFGSVLVRKSSNLGEFLQSGPGITAAAMLSLGLLVIVFTIWALAQGSLSR